MSRIDTLRDLFAHNDWARTNLLNAARPLSDAQLDRSFEMGLETFRKTFHHLWAAERVWLDRWLGHAKPKFVEFEPGVSLKTLEQRFNTAATERDDWLKKQSPSALGEQLTFTNSRGETFTHSYWDMLLHVCTHGVHHRAQAQNMLRQLGQPVPKPGIDYIFMKLSQDAPPVAHEADTIRRFYAYSDWANERMLDRAKTLSDAQLDRVFPMGLETIRKTLMHIRFAEQWWLENWTLGPGNPFPETPDSTTIRDLLDLFKKTMCERNEVVARLKDADLARQIRVVPRPGVERVFPMGVTMLQIITHGTHHRAQAINMVRHVGEKPPELDYLAWIRQ